MNTCVFCGFCERYACEHYAKSTPQTFILPVLLANSNFELRTGSTMLTSIAAVTAYYAGLE